MWKRILSVAHRAGFTRNETVVLLFLAAALMTGAALRGLREGEPQPVDVRVALRLQDSVFAASSAVAPAGHAGDPLHPGAPVTEPQAAHAARTNSAPRTAFPVDINAADARTLEELPGIGPATANKIVAHRDRHGPFRLIEDLMQVKGIGPKKFEQLRQFIIAK